VKEIWLVHSLYIGRKGERLPGQVTHKLEFNCVMKIAVYDQVNCCLYIQVKLKLAKN